MTEPDASAISIGYDAVYSAWPRAVTLHRIWREHVLGSDFPAGFEHISFLSWSEFPRFAAALRLEPGGKLADLACGTGGPGLLVARDTHTSLTGVDFSSVGVARAVERAETVGLAQRAAFIVGTFSDTGLMDGSVDAAMSLDALQYAPNKAAAMIEIARILRPGGRFAFTAFEMDTARVADLPVAWPDPVEDYRDTLHSAGFVVEVYEQTERWLERLTGAYSAVLAARDSLVQEMGEAAANSLLFEMMLTLERKPYHGRALVVAVNG